MRLATQAEEIQSGGLGAGNAFSIAASAKAFEVLSSNLYANKNLAVIREITCNAADAHTAAGRPFADIEVHLPTYSAQYFSVRDKGAGLAHEDVMHLYTTYFQSTKDSSNDLIGGFGLGSKSPFAVSDQFTVTSWHDGIRSDYVMYKDSGLPRVNLISQKPSAEHSGIEVRVAVAKDIDVWQSEARKFFAWWPNQPTINTTVPQVFTDANIAVKSSGLVDGYPSWAIFSTQDYGSAPRVFIGLVPYALNLGAVPGLPADVVELFTSMNMVLVFKVGEVSINPSREALSYDKNTCDVLVARLKDIASNLMRETNAAIAKLPTLYDARQFVFGGDVSGNALVSLISKKTQNNHKWNGLPVKAEVRVDLNPGPFASDITVHKYEYRPQYVKKWRKGWTENYTLLDSAGILEAWRRPAERRVPIYVWSPSVTSKTYRVCEHYADSNPGIRISAFLLVTGSTYADVSAQFLRLGLPPVADITTWPDPPKMPASIRSAPKTKGYTIDANGNSSRTESEIDLTTPGLFVPFFNANPAVNLQSHYFTPKALGWVSDLPLIGLTQTKLKSAKLRKLLVSKGWQELTPDWLLANIKAPAFQRAAAAAALHRHYQKTKTALFNYENHTKFVNLYNKYQQLPISASSIVGYPTLPVLALHTWVHPWAHHAADWAFDSVMPQALADAKAAGEKEISDMLGAVSQFLDDHPMLRHVTWNTLDFSTFSCYLERA